jgi:hypothetical protein
VLVHELPWYQLAPMGGLRPLGVNVHPLFTHMSEHTQFFTYICRANLWTNLGRNFHYYIEEN